MAPTKLVDGRRYRKCKRNKNSKARKLYYAEIRKLKNTLQKQVEQSEKEVSKPISSDSLDFPSCETAAVGPAVPLQLLGTHDEWRLAKEDHCMRLAKEESSGFTSVDPQPSTSTDLKLPASDDLQLPASDDLQLLASDDLQLPVSYDRQLLASDGLQSADTDSPQPSATVTPQALPRAKRIRHAPSRLVEDAVWKESVSNAKPPTKIRRLQKKNDEPITAETSSVSQIPHFSVQVNGSPEPAWAATSSEVEGETPVLQSQVKLEPPDSSDVAGQFEEVNVPNTGQWKDGQLVETNMLEPIESVEAQLCRLCVKNKGRVPLFQDGLLRVVAVQVMTVTRVKVSPTDGLPHSICAYCAELLSDFFNFKLQCEVADVTLRAKVSRSQVPDEVNACATHDKYALLIGQVDQSLANLNDLVMSLKVMQDEISNMDYLQPAEVEGTVATAESINIKLEEEQPSSPLPTFNEQVEIKTEIDVDEHMELEGVQSESCDEAVHEETQTDRMCDAKHLVQEKEPPAPDPPSQGADSSEPLTETAEIPTQTTILRAVDAIQQTEEQHSICEVQQTQSGLQDGDLSRVQLPKPGEPPTTPVYLQGGKLVRRAPVLVQASGQPVMQVYLPGTHMFLRGGHVAGARTYMPRPQLRGKHMLVGTGKIPSVLHRAQMLVPAGRLPRTQTLMLHGTQAAAGSLPRTQTIVQAGSLPEKQSVVQSGAFCGTQTVVPAGVLPRTQTFVQTRPVRSTQALVQTGTIPRTQALIQAGVIPTTQTVMQAGTIPRTQALVQAGVVPTTQTLMQAGTIPRTQALVQTGTIPRTQALVQAGVVPTTQTVMQAGVLPGTHLLVPAAALPRTQTFVLPGVRTLVRTNEQCAQTGEESDKLEKQKAA